MPPSASASSRQRFRRRRLRAVSGALGPAGVLAATGALLLAPDDLASVRLLGVSLGWWSVVAALGLVLGSLTVGGRRTPAAISEPPA